MRQFKIFFKSELIFTILYNKLKNGLRLPLTSQIKELEEILDFGIQKLNKFEPGLIQTNDNEKHETASLAMRMPSDLWSSGLGSVQRRNENVLTRTRKMRKESRFSLCLVKR